MFERRLYHHIDWVLIGAVLGAPDRIARQHP